jgi:hypothetical protein
MNRVEEALIENLGRKGAEKIDQNQLSILLRGWGRLMWQKRRWGQILCAGLPFFDLAVF